MKTNLPERTFVTFLLCLLLTLWVMYLTRNNWWQVFVVTPFIFTVLQSYHNHLFFKFTITQQPIPAPATPPIQIDVVQHKCSGCDALSQVLQIKDDDDTNVH